MPELLAIELGQDEPTFFLAVDIAEHVQHLASASELGERAASVFGRSFTCRTPLMAPAWMQPSFSDPARRSMPCQSYVTNRY